LTSDIPVKLDESVAGLMKVFDGSCCYQEKAQCKSPRTLTEAAAMIMGVVTAKDQVLVVAQSSRQNLAPSPQAQQLNPVIYFG
jgi:hypothetical protein